MKFCGLYKGGKRYRIIILMMLGCSMMWRCVPVYAEQVEVFYIEYPPYCETEKDGTPSGIFIDMARRILDRVGVGYRFSSVPPKRIVLEMQKGTPIVSIGWLRTAEREKIARFSIPVYVNRPVAVFALREKIEELAQYASFEEMMAGSRLTVGRIDGHSEGEYLDAILHQHKDRNVWVPGDEVQLIKMLVARRFDFTLLPPEEMEVLVRKAGGNTEDFILQPMKDIPTGNARYIMYSKTIDDSLIKQIDKVIAEEIRPEEHYPGGGRMK